MYGCAEAAQVLEAGISYKDVVYLLGLLLSAGAPLELIRHKAPVPGIEIAPLRAWDITPKSTT